MRLCHLQPGPTSARDSRLLRGIHHKGDAVVDMGGMLLGLGDSSTLSSLHFCLVLTLELVRKDAVYQWQIGICPNTEHVQSQKWLNCIFSVDLLFIRYIFVWRIHGHHRQTSMFRNNRSTFPGSIITRSLKMAPVVVRSTLLFTVLRIQKLKL